MSASQIDPKPPVVAQDRSAPAIAKGETSPATPKAAVAGRLLWMLFGRAGAARGPDAARPGVVLRLGPPHGGDLRINLVK